MASPNGDRSGEDDLVIALSPRQLALVAAAVALVILFRRRCRK